MGKKRKDLDQMPVKDKKTDLHNKFLMDLLADSPVLSGHCSQAEGHAVLKKVTDCLWYLDGRQKAKLQEKGFAKCYNFPRGIYFVSISLHTQTSTQTNFI